MAEVGTRADDCCAAPPNEAAAAARAPGRSARGPVLKLGVLALLLAGGYLLYSRTGLGEYVTREGIGAAIDWLRGNPWAPVIFVAVYTAATALAIPGSVLTLAGGAIFGFYWGTLLNLAAANIGANAAFAVARALGRDGVRHLAGKDSNALRRLDEVVARHGFRGLLTLRLIPIAPFNVLNFGSGLTSLTWRSYALATLIGIVPGTAVYTFFADALLQGSREASAAAWLRILAAGLLLVALSFLPAMLKRLNVRLPGMTVLAAALFAAFAPGTGAAQETPPSDPLPDHAALTEALAPVMEGSSVDYARLASEPEGLYGYIAALEGTELEAVLAASREEQLAFWINAYNACMLKRVIEHYPIKPAGGFLRIKNAAARRPANSVWQISDVFTGDHCPVAGEMRSQDEIEHEIIRPMGDPRIHFAVNCAARSCPPLVPEAYEAGSLEAQLDARAQSFVDDPFHFRAEADGGKTVVRINQVLDWFKEDFGGVQGVRLFLARYAGGDAAAALRDPGAEVKFIDYDWTLNDISR